MNKIVLNCKLKVKQALDKQDCDKVPLIVICIDSLMARVYIMYNDVVLLYIVQSTACL